jgi:dnd system-associated protein 4
MDSLAREIINKDVRRNKKYEDVVNILVNGSLHSGSNSSEKKIFNYIKDLIIFAAMVGKKYERKENVERENVGITLGTFSGGGGKGTNVDQHNIIFMFGLLIYKDMNYMRDSKVDQCIKIFEEYSNGGLGLIQEWLVESGWNSLCLLDKILDELNKDSTVGIEVIDNPF